MQWLSANSTSLILVANLGIIFIWLFYGYLLAWDFKRLRRPRLLITHSGQPGLDGYCTITNMGQASVYLSAVIAVVSVSGRTYLGEVTDYTHAEWSDNYDRQVTFQGPISPAQIYRLNTFRCLSEAVLGQAGAEFDHQELESIEVRIVATHGSDERSFGAYRRFTCDISSLIPASFQTRGLSRRWQQRTIHHWRQELEGQAIRSNEKSPA